MAVPAFIAIKTCCGAAMRPLEAICSRKPAAMAAGVTKRLWEIGELVDVSEAWEAFGA